MYKKISFALLGILAFLAFPNFSFAQEIPNGYVLVPISAFSQTQTAQVTSQVSANKSALRANEEMGFVGEKEVILTATLRDELGNPLIGKSVSLISSRASDVVKNIQATTDANGEALFAVSGREEGVSAFTAIAGNQTITERPKVVFLQNTKAIGGSLLRADLVDDLGDDEEVASYTLEIDAEVASATQVDTPIDITVSLKDVGGEVDENFVGSISFSSNDVSAILPRDYEFKDVDRGIHTFANAITFTTSGSKTIVVSADSGMVASKEVEVEVSGDAGDAQAPLLRNPIDGSMVSDSFELSGVAAANSNLAVFVDDQLFLEEESDANGSFAMDLELDDGMHEIKVALVTADNKVGVTSEAINIEVDSTPPELEEITFTPEAVTAGSEVRFVVKSEANLDSAKLTFGENTIQLVEESEGVYVGKFETSEAQTYKVNVELSDEAGNIKNFPEATTLKIQNALTIENIITTPKDKRVDLKWNPPSNHTEIRNYKIFYGVDKENLDKFYETPDSGTSWYVGGLNNDTVYYFQAISYDSGGKENGFSEVIEATPSSMLELSATGCDGKIILTWIPQDDSSIVNYRVDYGIASKEYVESRIISGGRETKEWEIRDLVNGVEYFATIRGMDALGEVVFGVDEEISAIPTMGACHFASPTANIQLWQREDEDGNTILVWNPIQGVVGYNVYAGTSPNTFNLPTVMVETPYLRPEGLTPNEDYYFAVKAVFTNGESETLSNVTKVEVGPAEILAISIGIALLGGYFLRRKRNFN